MLLYGSYGVLLECMNVVVLYKCRGVVLYERCGDFVPLSCMNAAVSSSMKASVLLYECRRVGRLKNLLTANMVIDETLFANIPL